MDEPGCICLDCETRLERLQPCTSCGSHRVDLWSPSWDAYPEYRVSYYDREGNQLTLLEYALKFGSDEARQEYKFVDRTDIGDFAYVSTVWLGANHRIGPGRPLIFESMAFLHTLPDDQPNPTFGRVLPTSLEEFVPPRRYATEAEARAGHRVMVAEVEAWLAEQRAWIGVAVADIEGEQE